MLALSYLADKSWQKILLADLLWEKNTAEWTQANKVGRLKNTFLFGSASRNEHYVSHVFF